MNFSSAGVKTSIQFQEKGSIVVADSSGRTVCVVNCSPTPQKEKVCTEWLHLTFGGVYALVLFFAAGQIYRILSFTRRFRFSLIISVHLLVALVALYRCLVSLLFHCEAETDHTVSTLNTLIFLETVPYLWLEMLFAAIVYIWSRMFHFDMKTSSPPFGAVKMPFFVILGITAIAIVVDLASFFASVLARASILLAVACVIVGCACTQIFGFTLWQLNLMRSKTESVVNHSVIGFSGGMQQRGPSLVVRKLWRHSYLLGMAFFVETALFLLTVVDRETTSFNASFSLVISLYQAADIFCLVLVLSYFRELVSKTTKHAKEANLSSEGTQMASVAVHSPDEDAGVNYSDVQFAVSSQPNRRVSETDDYEPEEVSPRVTNEQHADEFDAGNDAAVRIFERRSTLRRQTADEGTVLDPPKSDDDDDDDEAPEIVVETRPRDESLIVPEMQRPVQRKKRKPRKKRDHNSPRAIFARIVDDAKHKDLNGFLRAEREGTVATYLAPQLAKHNLTPEDVGLSTTEAEQPSSPTTTTETTAQSQQDDNDDNDVGLTQFPRPESSDSSSVDEEAEPAPRSP